MNKRLITVAAAIIAVGGITATIAGGLYQTLPIVGEPAYCASTVTGISSPANQPYLQPPGSTQGTGSTICGQTVPAGPTILTGNEIVPADTLASSNPYNGLAPSTLGAPPATVAVPIILLDSGAYTYSTPNATLANFSLVNPTNWLIMDGTAVLTAINITLPGTPYQQALNGQQVHIVTAKSITTLAVAGATGTTITNAPTTLLVGATVSTAALSFIYDSTISTWFRTQ